MNQRIQDKANDDKNNEAGTAATENTASDELQLGLQALSGNNCPSVASPHSSLASTRAGRVKPLPGRFQRFLGRMQGELLDICLIRRRSATIQIVAPLGGVLIRDKGRNGHENYRPGNCSALCFGHIPFSRYSDHHPQMMAVLNEDFTLVDAPALLPKPGGYYLVQVGVSVSVKTVLSEVQVGFSNTAFNSEVTGNGGSLFTDPDFGIVAWTPDNP